MKTALWFSGGKDSLACLLLHRDRLDEIVVLWANTGKNYPEVLEFVERIRAMCPHWVEVKTDRDGQWASNGYPADVVPIDYTVTGQLFTGEKPVKIQSYLQCCYENIGGALWAKTLELGFSEVIRGQRADESHRSTAKDGDQQNGVTFRHPIEDWTKPQVMRFIEKEFGELPEHFSLDHSSMDCYDCTAFTEHTLDRAAYTKAKHPKLYAEYRIGLSAVLTAIKQATRHYEHIDNLN